MAGEARVGEGAVLPGEPGRHPLGRAEQAGHGGRPRGEARVGEGHEGEHEHGRLPAAALQHHRPSGSGGCRR